MKRLSLVVWLVLLAGTTAWAGQYTAPVYINPGNVTYTNTPPQIDAYGFINLGTFEVYDPGSQPAIYDFMNVLDYTNRGVMIGYPGFRFDTTDDFGRRKLARQLVNNGIIAAGEADAYIGYSNVFSPTYLFIAATNVVSPGLLSVMNAGNLRVEGKTVNLSRGGLEVESLQSFPWANVYYDTQPDGVPDYFDPDNAIYDIWWGTGVQDPPLHGPIYPPGILRFGGQGIIATSPSHLVSNKFASGMVRFSTYMPIRYNTTFAYTGVVESAFFALTNADGSVSNMIVPTNIYRQAVVVGIGDTNIQVVPRFYQPNRRFPAVVTVRLSAATTNIVSGSLEVNSLYFVDYLGAETNLLIVANEMVIPVMTSRPYDYEIWREDPGLWGFGANGNSALFKSILHESFFYNGLATNVFDGYAASVDFLESRPPIVPGVTPTNLPGRLEITADTLDLSNARLRGMGAINIRAKHLASSAGAKVDVPYLSYDFASTNGLLTITNLAQLGVDRFSGPLYAWSGLWTNNYLITLTNWTIGPTNTPNLVTNQVDCTIHCLLLGADEMTTTQAMVAYAFTARSTNVVVNDALTVGGAFRIEASSFTVNGQLLLTNNLLDWVYTNAPTLTTFTNNGVVSVYNVANYGAGYPDGRHWERLVNTGTLLAVGHNIVCDEFIDSGLINSSGSFVLTAGSAKLSGAIERTGGDAQIYAQDMKLQGATINPSLSLILSVTNNLADSGPAANNQITVGDGFYLTRKPKTGDLLGTTFTTAAPQFQGVNHGWAAEDRGASKNGFTDNVAIGMLALRVFTFGELRFGPPRDELGYPQPGNYGLYADYLWLDQGLQAMALQGNIESAGLVIESGLTIYFAAANVPVELLDGKFGGRLRWVQDYAGPKSGTDIAVHTAGGLVTTIKVNTALLNSTSLDSDGDGLANAFDPWPFDGPTITDFKLTASPGQALLSWGAALGTVYRVEYTPGLSPAKWQTLTVLTNNAASAQTLTVTDLVGSPPVGAARFYRVSYVP
jgi:hypothetical protein